MNDLFVRIRFLLPSLPRAEKAIASALLEKHQLSDSVKEWDMMDILL